jgi:hypothetical protein
MRPRMPSTTYDASDEETAAVAGVAAHNGTPFIAFRAVSDGQGDPLKLPGFPAQFFVYRQLAADNAASVAAAFLDAWAKRPHAAPGSVAMQASSSGGSGDVSGVTLTGSPNTSAAAPVLPPLLALAVLAVVCVAARLSRRRPTG